MGRRTGRGERAGEREHGDGLALEQVVGRHVLPLVLNAGAKRYLGYALAFTGCAHAGLL